MNRIMHVLGAFMAVAGCAAVAAGLVVAGVGLFATATCNNRATRANESLDDAANVAY